MNTTSFAMVATVSGGVLLSVLLVVMGAFALLGVCVVMAAGRKDRQRAEAMRDEMISRRINAPRQDTDATDEHGFARHTPTPAPECIPQPQASTRPVGDGAGFRAGNY